MGNAGSSVQPSGVGGAKHHFEHLHHASHSLLGGASKPAGSETSDAVHIARATLVELGHLSKISSFGEQYLHELGRDIQTAQKHHRVQSGVYAYVLAIFIILMSLVADGTFPGSDHMCLIADSSCSFDIEGKKVCGPSEQISGGDTMRGLKIAAIPFAMFLIGLPFIVHRLLAITSMSYRALAKFQLEAFVRIWVNALFKEYTLIIGIELFFAFMTSNWSGWPHIDWIWTTFAVYFALISSGTTLFVQAAQQSGQPHKLDGQAKSATA